MTARIDIGAAEKLLNDWREAQAVVDTLIEFRANGGEHRMRMRTDGPESAVPANLIDRLLAAPGGYSSILSSAINRAQINATNARSTFLAECAGQHLSELAEDLEGRR